MTFLIRLSVTALAALTAATTSSSVSAFVVPSIANSKTHTVTSVNMQPDGFDNWMQPDGQDYDMNPHPRNQGVAGHSTPRERAAALKWQQQQFEEMAQNNPNLEMDQSQVSNDGNSFREQWKQQQAAQNAFIDNPYGTNGPNRYGYGINNAPQGTGGNRPPPQQPMQQQQQRAPQQQQGPPSRQQQNVQPPEYKAQQNFIENPYGNRPAPAGYAGGQSIPPRQQRRQHLSPYSQQGRDADQDFINNSAGTNRMEYGFGDGVGGGDARVTRRTPSQNNQRMSPNNPNGPSSFTNTPGQYGHGNDGDVSGGEYDYYGENSGEGDDFDAIAPRRE